MRYLIIGYSVAAVNAIKAIRSLNDDSEITVITEEERLYSRPLISYYVADKLTEDKLSFVEDDFDRKYKINVLYLTKANYIDTEKKQVYTNKKDKIPYDKLLITTGGKPIIPNIDGYKDDIEGIFTFTTLKDAKKLLNYIKTENVKSGVILGGGLIGIKAAEALLEKGIRLVIIDIADRLLANTFDKKASNYIEKKLAGFGGKFLPNNTIKKIITKDNKLKSVILEDGQTIETNLLILAIGVKPNIEVLKNTNIKISIGVVVDKFMRTNVNDIYSAGDVVETQNFITNQNSVLAIWPVAAIQGKVAGLNMAGKETIYDGMFPMNSVEILGVPSISFGVTNVEEKDGFEVLSKEDENFYRKIILKDNKVVGVILVGNIDRAGLYGMLIREKLDVSKFKNELIKDDFGILVLPKDFRKHLVAKEIFEI